MNVSIYACICVSVYVCMYLCMCVCSLLHASSPHLSYTTLNPHLHLSLIEHPHDPVLPPPSSILTFFPSPHTIHILSTNPHFHPYTVLLSMPLALQPSNLLPQPPLSTLSHNPHFHPSLFPTHEPTPCYTQKPLAPMPTA